MMLQEITSKRKAVENAEQMRSKRLCPKTQANYASKIALFTKWIRLHADNDVMNHYDVDTDSVKLPVPTGVLMEFFGYIGDEAGIEDDVSDDDVDDTAANKTGHYRSFSTVSGYRSAIVSLYKSRKLMESFPTTEIGEFLAGFKRSIAVAKENGTMPLHEGKRPLTFESYRKICEHSLQNGYSSNQYLCNLLSVLFCWNLMSRSISVATLKYTNISWSGDALVIELPRHKGDQEGASVYPKHVFANALDPLICPILHLGIKLCCSNKLDLNKNCVFEGSKVENKFSKWLMSLLNNLSESEFMVLGFSPNELGTHSFRKGASTYASSKNGGPSMVAIYHRAGWCIGNVQKRYIFPTVGQDQMVGRVLCGLPWQDERYCILPPHFKDVSKIDVSDWELLVPGYCNYPASFRSAIPFVMASVIYHVKWIEENLPKSHPYFASRLYTTRVCNRLSNEVVTGYDNCEYTKMSATGIPESAMITKRLHTVEDTINALQNMCQRIDDNGERRLKSTMTDLPGVIVQCILDNISIEGAAPLSRMDMENS
jgi:hypothetical protein